MQIIVLGMHRSGTSTVTRLVNMMGAYFGSEAIATRANAENPKGFWERQDVRDVNDMLLHAAGLDWDRIATYDPGAIPEACRALFEESASAIIDDLDTHRPWVVKEPRMCVTLPLWLRLLRQPVFLIVVRHPVEIASSLLLRNSIPLTVGVALATVTYHRLLENTASLPRVVVRYADVIADPLAVSRDIYTQLADWGATGLELPAEREIQEFVDPSLYRHRRSVEAGKHYLTDAQQSFFAALLAGDWQALGDLEPDVAPELELLRLYESERAARQAVKNWTRKYDAQAKALREMRKDSEDKKKELEGKIHELDIKSNKLSQLEGDFAIQTAECVDLARQRDALARDASRHEAHQIEVVTGSPRPLENTAGLVTRLREQLWRTQTELAGVNADARLLKQKLTKTLSQLQRGLDEIERSTSWRFGYSLAAFYASVRRKAGSPVFPLLRESIARGHQSLRSSTSGEHVERRQLPPAAPRSVRPSQVFSDALRSPTESVKTSSIATPRVSLQGSHNDGKCLKLTVAVIAWDTGHNPLGRAHLIADALSRNFNVLLLGPSFVRFGSDVWSPLQDASIRVVQIRGGTFPKFAAELERIAPLIQADVIVACKPRLPSLQLGLLMKKCLNRPLLIDIDDWELSFFSEKTPCDTTELAALSQSSWGSDSAGLDSPFGQVWTRFAETLVPLGDAIFVSNVALQARFGGVLVPHARDEYVFDPSRYNREEARRRLGLERHHRVILFLGTPRRHKGVVEVAAAVRALDHPNDCFCVIGDISDKQLSLDLIAAGNEKLVLMSSQPFSLLPQTVLAADVVCLMQDPAHPTSRYQLPAKAIDALAMGVPVIATDIPPMRDLISEGVVIPATPENLGEVLGRVLNRRTLYRRAQLERRRLFLAKYSYAAVARTITEKIANLLDTEVQPLPSEALRFVGIQKALPSPGVSEGLEKEPPVEDGRDVIVFWKQNDSGLYGRRVDMMAKYLSRSSGIRRVLVIDRPIGLQALMAKQSSGEYVHDGDVFTGSWRKAWGLAADDRLSYHVFIYGDARSAPKGVWPWQRFGDYSAYLEKLFRFIGVDVDRAIFLAYPKVDGFKDLHARFRPWKTVIDVVDDQRSWPGIGPEKIGALTAHYHAVVALADVVVANCQSVREAMTEFTDTVHLITNACEVEDPPTMGSSHASRRFDALQGPLIGYVGNMEAKLDIQLIAFIAKARPLWQIALIGSTHSNPAVRELDVYPNIHFFGVVPYPEVRAWVARLDAAMIPHLDTPQTRSMNPLKLYLYGSLGVPTVCTPIANIDDLRGFVQIAGTKEAFVARLEDAMARKAAGGFEIPAEVLRANSWDERVVQLLSLIDTRLI